MYAHSGYSRLTITHSDRTVSNGTDTPPVSPPDLILSESHIFLRVWDLPTRLLHWSLVVLIGISWLSDEISMMTVHTTSGLLVLTLLVFRLLWGIVGSTTACFSHFVHRPRAVWAYLTGLLDTFSEPPVGHNPAGGVAIVLMLATLTVQAASGLFANDDIYTEGPLAHLVSKSVSDLFTILHKATFNVLFSVLSLHLLANLFYLVIRGENLVLPMITGRRNWPAGRAVPQLYFAGSLRTLVVLALAMLMVGGLLFL